ncbi:four helix bundle protein [Microcoleus sp. F4-D5]|uniref:four helix bundle protein n=1 Tax=Microcoleus sp. F4-D5 TaxID=2818760 RepID=UPI002FD63CF5
MGRVYEGYDGQTNSAIADSVGANIAEGHGRYSCQDSQRFVKIALESLKRNKTLVKT